MPFSWHAISTVRVKVLGGMPWILMVAMLGLLLILVVTTDPGHRPGQFRLVAALRRDVEQVIGAVQQVKPAAVGRIGVKDHAVLAAKGTDARVLLAVRLDGVEIVPEGRLVLGERDAIVEVEVDARRRDPAESPAHALAVGLELLDRPARDHDERGVARCEVIMDAVEVVRPVGAAGAALVPVWSEHEMLDDQLPAPGEEFGQGHATLGRLEDILLLDLLPGQ